MNRRHVIGGGQATRTIKRTNAMMTKRGWMRRGVGEEEEEEEKEVVMCTRFTGLLRVGHNVRRAKRSGARSLVKDASANNEHRVEHVGHNVRRAKRSGARSLVDNLRAERSDAERSGARSLIEDAPASAQSCAEKTTHH